MNGRGARLWTPGDPDDGLPGPFLPELPGACDARLPGGLALAPQFLQPIGPSSPAAKLIYLPTGDSTPLQFDQYTGSLVSDPGTPRWQAVKTSDDSAHFIAAHLPNGTKRNVSTIEAVNYAGPLEHWLDFRACYFGVVPTVGTSFTFIVTTADGEQLTAGPLNVRTGTYALTNNWKDFSVQLNDNGFVGAPASALMELRAAIPSGYGGYLAITYAAVRIVP